MTENVTQMDEFLKTQIENLERKNRLEEQRNEHLRQELITCRDKLEKLQVENPDFHEEYQVVDPNNQFWMQHADLFLNVYTVEYDSSFQQKKHRVATIPVPDMTHNLHWYESLPRSRKTDADGKTTYEVMDTWEMVSEDEFGQVWEKPEYEDDQGITHPKETCLIETEAQYRKRERIEKEKNLKLAKSAAKALSELYEACGGWPDAEVYVGLTFPRVELL